MGRFSKHPKIVENRIENAGRWPVRFTRFQLIDDYTFPATNFPEFYFVESGTFLHETELGTQALRAGAAIMVCSRQQHQVIRPEGAVLVRLRYMPEWFVREYEIVVRSPDVLGLFFAQSWLRVPRDHHIHIFRVRGKADTRVRAEIEYLQDLFRQGQRRAPIARASILKLMGLLASEHRRFWRGATLLAMPETVLSLLDRIEDRILRGESLELPDIASSKKMRHEVELSFHETTGFRPVDYFRRRRCLHAAFRLLETGEEIFSVGRTLGWSKNEDFEQHFEEIFEISPDVYRRKYGRPEFQNDQAATIVPAN